MRTFPRTSGIRRVLTRLLNNCSVGSDTPAPAPMYLDSERGTYN